MKRPLFMTAILLFAYLPCTAQSTPDLNGTWALAYDVAGLSIAMTCVIKQADKGLSGTCTGDDKAVHQLSGEVKDSSITFKFDKTYDNSVITDTFVSPKGVEAGKMAGTMSVAPLNISGTFTATKQ